ncbi:membrane-spanning 4-domains subfamily A member 15-like isoform X1 [Rana temporaria]|uniref:membrane-spanning 4-domains subfamily A member 15-like isoform X1 n=1 Tax=Rana temporaria TaxID=8407 RepID=UPI001AAC8F8B|nr:membrane-spanning 4-domains subfamily A member 15-like isoform X1 [Rana temporaria]
MDSREAPLRLHFHDTVQINIHSSSQPRWDDPPPATHCNNTTVAGRRNVPPQLRRRNETEEFHQIFLRAKPKLRGVFQIFLAHFQLALGIGLIYIDGINNTRLSYITFWGPTILVISGSIALRARVIPSRKLVKTCFILQTISCSVSIAGIALCAIDDFRIYTHYSGGLFGNVGTLAIINFLLVTNLVQLVSSGCMVIYSYHSLKCISRNQSQATAAQNLGVISLDPPAYSEVSSTLPQLPVQSQSLVFPYSPTYLYPPESTGPPVYNNLPEYSQPPVFSPTVDPPPPYSQ